MTNRTFLKKTKLWSPALGMLVIGCAFSGGAQALAVSGESGAYGVNVEANGLVTGQVLATPEVSGTAPAPYSETDSVTDLDALGIVQTGVIVVNAASDVDGAPGIKFANADSTVNELSIVVPGLLEPLVTITATTVMSEASVTGEFPGSLTVFGDSLIEDLMVSGSLLGTDINIAGDAAAGPNTVLLNEPGITLILNEQIQNGDSIIVNALHLIVDVAGVQSVDIIIAQSRANLTAVPLPAAVWMLMPALGMLGVIRRRRWTS